MIRPILRSLFSLLVLAGLFAAIPVSAKSNLDDLRYSVSIYGTIDINAEGTVSRFEIDHLKKYDKGVQDLGQRTVQSWRFEKTEGGAPGKNISTRFHLFISGEPIGKDEIALKAGEPFYYAPEFTGITAAMSGKGQNLLKPPVYPAQVVRMGVSGTVLLAVKVGADGRVLDVTDLQVNLRNKGTPKVLERARNLLAQTSIKTARQDWTFIAQSLPAGKDFGTVIVPVDFSLAQNWEPWHWNIHLPGPKAMIPWETEAFNAQSAPESLPSGMAYSATENPGAIRLVKQEG